MIPVTRFHKYHPVNCGLNVRAEDIKDFVFFKQRVVPFITDITSSKLINLFVVFTA